MTRGKKTIRNLAVTAAVLALYVWMTGGFLSPADCVMTSMEQIGFAPCAIVREEVIGRTRVYLLRNAQGLYAVHGVRRGLLLWYADGGETHMDLKAHRTAGAPGGNAWGAHEDYSYALFVRDDETVDTAVWTAPDGQICRASDWVQDCVLVLVPGQVRWRTLTLYHAGVPVFTETP